jgi:hypothetical protein
MAVVPSGLDALHAKTLRALIASTAAFRTWTGTGTQAAAEARILYLEGHAAASAAQAPYGAVGLPEDDIEIRIIGSPNTGVVAGDLVFGLFDYINPLNDELDEVMTFWNSTGGIIKEMVENAGTTADLMSFTRMIVGKPTLEHPDQVQQAAAGRLIEQFFKVFYEDSPVV